MPQNLIGPFIAAGNSWECCRQHQKFSKHPKNVRECHWFYSNLWEPFRTNKRASERLRTSQNIKQRLRTFKNLSVLLRSRKNTLECLRTLLKFRNRSKQHLSEHFRNASEHSGTLKINSEPITTFKKASDLPRKSKDTSERLTSFQCRSDD